jgi:hypothetical protein
METLQLKNYPKPGWKVWDSKKIEYRGYRIDPWEYGGYTFCRGDYDAELVGEDWKGNARIADSIDHAIELIDEEIAERNNTYVFLSPSGKYLVAVSAEDLEGAMQCSDVKRGATLLSVNKVRIEDYKFPQR